MSKGSAIGLWDMMDMTIAGELGVDVDVYIDIIDKKCTEKEAEFIIMTILTEDADNLEKAKETFNKYRDGQGEGDN
jgi:hypothetical protein